MPKADKYKEVKVVYFDIRRNETYERTTPQWALDEEIKLGFVKECPDCQTWVDTYSPLCSCGHKFIDEIKGYEISYEKFAGRLPTERFIRPTPDTVRHEVEICGRLYVAEYKEVPLSEVMNKDGIVKDAFIEQGRPFLHKYLLETKSSVK